MQKQAAAGAARTPSGMQKKESYEYLPHCDNIIAYCLQEFIFEAPHSGQLSLLQYEHGVMAVTLKSALARQLTLSSVLACTLFRIAVRAQSGKHISGTLACFVSPSPKFAKNVQGNWLMCRLLTKGCNEFSFLLGMKLLSGIIGSRWSE